MTAISTERQPARRFVPPKSQNARLERQYGSRAQGRRARQILRSPALDRMVDGSVLCAAISCAAWGIVRGPWTRHRDVRSCAVPPCSDAECKECKIQRPRERVHGIAQWSHIGYRTYRSTTASW